MEKENREQREKRKDEEKRGLGGCSLQWKVKSHNNGLCGWHKKRPKPTRAGLTFWHSAEDYSGQRLDSRCSLASSWLVAKLRQS